MSLRAALIALSLFVLAPRTEAFCGFFVAGSGEKLTNIKKVKRDENGVVQLSPLRVSYESSGH